MEVTFNYFSYGFNIGKGNILKRKEEEENLIQIQIQVHKVQGHYQYHHIDTGPDSVNQKKTILLPMT